MPYPANIYDRPKNLLAVLGTFWADMYTRRDQVSSYVRAKAGIELQTSQDLLELLSALSRYEVPLYHTDNWYELRLRESEHNAAQTSLRKYDGSGAYDAGDAYDVPVDSPFHAFPLPPDLVAAGLIFNRFLEPSLTWTQDIDFQLDAANAALLFHTNPFSDSRVLVRPVYADGVVVDREAVLWIYRGSFDWETAYRQFGYVLGLRMASSPGYRNLLNAVFDAIVGGTAKRDIELAFSAVTGIPLAQESVETVEEIALDKSHRLIITDRHVYKFDPEAMPLVAVGDTVHAGDPLVDALQISEFNRGQLDTDLRALVMGPGFLSSCFYSELVFENKSVPLEVITDDPSGYTKLSFSLGGFPADVERFFDDVHAAGVAAAQRSVDLCADNLLLRIPGDGCETEDVYYRQGTLAHLLDLRPVRDGEPGPAALPGVINPLQFLVENLLRANAFLVRIKSRYLGTDGLGLHTTRILQKIVPPHTAMLVLVELTAETDSVTTTQITEAISTLDAAEPIRDDVPTTQLREGIPTLRAVGTY